MENKSMSSGALSYPMEKMIDLDELSSFKELSFASSSMSGYSPRSSCRSEYDIEKEITERRIREISNEAISNMKANQWKFKRDINTLKHKVHAIVRK
mmetsp:Transcript_38769/g.44364  ORF Transcript_38769/g.44364 Transcript_38769/m.44364 type:complete len:97 (+) Transcript_38769:27-317(+)